jgi:hypothetical protein
MALIYENDGKGAFSGIPPKYESLNAVAGYLRHYGNLLYLQFIANNTNDAREKIQASKEMAIAERKMSWWEKHPNYVQAEVLRGVEKLKRDWRR